MRYPASLANRWLKIKPVTEQDQPPGPELSRIAWVASSRIDSARNERRPIYRIPPEVLAMIVEFRQSERFENYHPKGYEWVCLMLVSHMWKTTILSFPSIWSKLVMSASISQSGMATVVERSGSHPLQVVIPPPELESVYPKSIRYKHVSLIIGLLPRISKLSIVTRSVFDTLRICDAFEGCRADRLERLNFIGFPGLGELFALDSPQLRFLYLCRVDSWPARTAENLTHVHLGGNMNPDTLERDLKHSPGLQEIRIENVYQVPERVGDYPKIRLAPGVRLVITSSQNTVASLFVLETSNSLSIKTTNIAIASIPITSFLRFALPRDLSRFRNLDNLTKVHLKLLDSGEGTSSRTARTVTVFLRCSTADREMLHVEVDYILSCPQSSNTLEGEVITERPPAMRALNYLRPLDLKKVVELKMEGFVREWGLQSFELRHFLQFMPALKRIATADDNERIFQVALNAMERNASVTVEGV